MIACAKCGLDNPAGSKFCAGCGTAVPVNPRRASCGTKSPAGSKFCKSCGAGLQGSAQSVSQSMPLSAEGLDIGSAEGGSS